MNEDNCLERYLSDALLAWNNQPDECQNLSKDDDPTIIRCFTTAAAEVSYNTVSTPLSW